MASLVIIHPLLRRIYEYFASPKGAASTPGESAKGSTWSSRDLGDTRLRRRVTFDLYFSCVFLTVLTGTSALKILLILYINFLIATWLPRKHIPTTTWVFNVGVLFANELCRGYPYAEIESLFFLPSLAGDEKAVASSWGAKLDSYGGLLPRWEVLFKLTILRLISFNFDYYWGAFRETSGNIEVDSALSLSTSSHFSPRVLLTDSRKSAVTPPPSPNATVSKPHLHYATSPCATTSHIPFTPRSTSPAPSSLSMTTSTSSASHSSLFPSNAPFSTGSAS